MKIIVTGAAGFIGSCLLWKLNREGVTDILAVDEPQFRFSENLDSKQFTGYIGKKEFPELLESGSLPRPDAIVHMGACSSTLETDIGYLTENNYVYTRRLAQWCLKTGVPFLYASSAATYGDGEFGYSDSDENSLRLKPLNPYGRSKQMFDLWVIENRLSGSLTGFKFFNVFGPNEYHKGEMRSVVCKSFARVIKDRKISLFKSYRKDFADGEQKRDFIYVKDAVDLVWHFILNPHKKGIFNIGSGCARSWNDVARALFAALQMEPRIEYIEMPAQLREKYQYFTQADLAKLRRAGVNHTFFTLEDAIKDYVGYLKESRFL